MDISKDALKTYYRVQRNKRKDDGWTDNKAIRKEYVDSLKASIGCAVCGFNDYRALQFHHIDPTQKESLVSVLVRNGPFESLVDEIDKCIVLCANHHQILHHPDSDN